MTERKPGPLSAIQEAVLVDVDGKRHRAADLWASQPVLFLLIKRPGCVLCRAHARRIWSVKPTFDEMGVKLVCLVGSSLLIARSLVSHLRAFSKPCSGAGNRQSRPRPGLTPVSTWFVGMGWVIGRVVSIGKCRH